MIWWFFLGGKLYQVTLLWVVVVFVIMASPHITARRRRNAIVYDQNLANNSPIPSGMSAHPLRPVTMFLIKPTFLLQL